MAKPIDPKQLASLEELLISQVISQDALIRLLIEKGLFTKEEFWEIVKVVDREMKSKPNEIKKGGGKKWGMKKRKK